MRNETEVCTNCWKKETIILDHTQGVKVCSNCGLVVNDRIIDETSEWRNFSGDGGFGGNDGNRVGGPSDPLLNGRGLIITMGNNDQQNKFTKWQNFSSMNSTDKSLTRGFERLKNAAYRLDIDEDILNTSKEFFKTVQEKTKLKGKNLDAVVAATLYVAAKEKKAPLNLKRIQENINVEKKMMNKCIKGVQNILSQKKPKGNYSDYVRPLGNNLKLKIEPINVATEITKRAEKIGLVSGKNPHSVAGASILLSCQLLNEPIEIKKISDYAQIAEATIKGAYKKIFNSKNELIPDDYKERAKNLQLL
jgi:transcription initiation factor TFIIB